MKRLFIGLEIPDEIAESLAPLQNGVRGARFSPRENFHITLRFIGDLDFEQCQDLIAELGNIRNPQIDLALAGVDFFGRESPHSIHAKVCQSPSLLDLAKKCENACRRLGHEPETRKYIPHLTLAYLGKDAVLANVLEWQARHNLFKTNDWHENKFYLYSSKLGNGPSHYEIEAEYFLNS